MKYLVLGDLLIANSYLIISLVYIFLDRTLPEINNKCCTCDKHCGCRSEDTACHEQRTHSAVAALTCGLIDFEEVDLLCCLVSLIESTDSISEYCKLEVLETCDLSRHTENGSLYIKTVKSVNEFDVVLDKAIENNIFKS